MVIPDALLGFSHSEKGFKRQFIIAIEYDAGTENPQYFGRDKVQKYGNELQVGNPIFSNKGFQVLVFADTRRRIFQLLKHSYKFLQKDLQFFFASMEDLAESGNLFAPIFISPEKSFVTDKLILCSAFE